MSITTTLTTLSPGFFLFLFPHFLVIERLIHSDYKKTPTFSYLTVYADGFGSIDSEIYDSKTWAASPKYNGDEW